MSIQGWSRLHSNSVTPYDVNEVYDVIRQPIDFIAKNSIKLERSNCEVVDELNQQTLP
jgi:hypothetical protein